MLKLLALLFFLTASCAAPDASVENGTPREQNPAQQQASIQSESSEQITGCGMNDASVRGSLKCLGTILARPSPANLQNDENGRDEDPGAPNGMRSVKTASPLPRKVCNLSKLISFNGTENDAAPTLQSCINSTPRNGTLAIPFGIYTLHSYLRIDRGITLTTKGLALNSPDCHLSNR